MITLVLQMLDLAQHKSAFQVVIHEGNSIKRIRMSHSHILMWNTRSSAALESRKHECLMMTFCKENRTYLGTARCCTLGTTVQGCARTGTDSVSINCMIEG